MRSIVHLATIAALSSVAITPTFAQTTALRSERQLSLESASRLAADTVAACHADGHAVSATVVDRAGVVRAVLRADGAGPHTIEASRLKAYTAASARNTTSAMMETAQKNPGAANLRDIPGFLLLGGGVPVRIGDEVVGAIGVGGAPGGHLDERCATAAIEANRERLR